MKSALLWKTAAAAAVCVLLAGCGSSEDAYEGSLESTVSEAPIEIITDSDIPEDTESKALSIVESVPDAIPAEAIVPEIIASEGIVIGEKSEDAAVLHRKLTNATGVGITGLFIKDQFTDDFGGNLMAEGTNWKNLEAADLYYDESEALKQTADTEPVYRMRLLFEDGTEAELYAVPIRDFEEASIAIHDGLCYLEYMDGSGNAVSTLSDERDYHGLSDDEDGDSGDDQSSGQDEEAPAEEESADNTEETQAAVEEEAETLEDDGFEEETVGEITEDDHEALENVDESEDYEEDYTDYEDGEEEIVGELDGDFEDVE